MALIVERQIRFDLTCDDVEIKGVTSIELPTIAEQTVEVEGSGIMGSYETPVLGQLENMEVTMDLTHASPDEASILLTPENHEVGIYRAVQVRDSDTDEISIQKQRFYLRVRPKSVSEGTAENDSTDNGKATYSCSLYRKYIDGEKICEINPLSSIYIWNGVDYYEEVREALDL